MPTARARYGARARAISWSRNYTAKLLNMKVGDLRVYPAEIGGGFGGKTVVYVEPVAVDAVEKVRPGGQDRDEPRGDLQAHRPDLGLVDDGQDRRQAATARSPRPTGVFKFQAGAFPGSPVMNDVPVRVAPYNIANARTVGYDVVATARRRGLSRPGLADLSLRSRERARHLAKKIGMDPLQLRLKNAAQAGNAEDFGRQASHGGYRRNHEGAARTIRPTSAPLGPNQGRGVASGYWFNGGGKSSATVQVNEDGTVMVATGSPDIGGSRASMALMAAETWASITTRCARSSPIPPRSATPTSPAARA